MNFRNNLTAFSWKPLKLTVGKRGLPITLATLWRGVSLALR